MMITFSALINIILFSGIAVALLGIVLKNNRVVLQLDVRFLLICMLIILFRLLIPIESPITRNIAVSRIYPDIYMFLKMPVMKEFGLNISILTILGMIWFAGALFFSCKLIYSYKSIKKSVKCFDEVKDRTIIDMVDQINAQHRKTKAFKLVTDDFIYTAFVFGIVKPYIVIPHIEMSREELNFILKHEMTHYYRGDLIIKLFSEILKAVYWWNPFVYLLCKLLAQVQEINVDFCVMKELSGLRKLDYSEFLVKAAKAREMQKAENEWEVAFQKENSLTVHKRVDLMLGNIEAGKKKTLAGIVLSIVIVCQVVLCPNIFVFEPYDIPEEDEIGTFELNIDDAFYLKNSDNTYSLYLNGQYAISVEEIFDERIPIYKDLKEVDRDD